MLMVDLRPNSPWFGGATFGWASSNIDKQSMLGRLEAKRFPALTGTTTVEQADIDIFVTFV